MMLAVYAMTYGVNFSGILSRDLCRIAAASRMPFAFLSLLTFTARIAIAPLVDSSRSMLTEL
jgi:hypothetical protein